MRFDDFITPDPLFDLALGAEPDNSPDTQIVFVVYRGHEPEWGTLSAIMPGSFAVKDSDIAKDKPFETEIVCVCDAEADAKRIVVEKNALVGPDDVQYKYHAEFFFNGLYAGFNMSQLETLAVILFGENEYSVSNIRPVYAFLSEDMISEKVEQHNNGDGRPRPLFLETVVFVPYIEDSNRNPNTFS